MTDHRDELTTADIADQPATDSERAEPDRPDTTLDAERGGPVTDERLRRDDRMLDADAPLSGEPHQERSAVDDLDRTRASAPAEGSSVESSRGTDTVGASAAGPLLASTDAEGFRARWTDVQTAFVDAPRRSVEEADALVAELMQHLARTFADERGQLERQWDRGDDIPTDELRTAFQRYRSFFERLLAT
jgi:hypothetical protein